MVGIAKPCGRLNEGIEHSLQIERRTADDLEHVSGSGLLLEGFAQLIEQTCVLNGDDGLIGKGSDQIDLLIGERLYNRSPDEDHPYDISLPQERGSEPSSIA